MKNYFYESECSRNKVQTLNRSLLNFTEFTRNVNCFVKKFRIVMLFKFETYAFETGGQIACIVFCYKQLTSTKHTTIRVV